MRRKASWGVSAFIKTGCRPIAFLGVLLLLSLQSYSQYSITICSGSATGSFVHPSAPSTETYSWTVAPFPNTVGATAGNAQPSINQTLTNSSNTPVSVTYTVASNSGAYGFTLVVNVNPLPRIAGSIAATSICTGGTFSFNTASSTPGASATWTRAAVTGISNGAVTAPQSGNIIEALNNTTVNPVATVYAVALTANGCGFTQPINVTVNPLPTLNSTLTPLAGATGGPGFCSGTAFTYTATSLQSPNVTFSWSRPVVAGNAAAGPVNSASINETLTNNGTSVIQVDYTFDLQNTSTFCTNTETVTTYIKPIPSITNMASAPTTVCSGSAVVFNPTSSMAGTALNWTRASAPNVTPTSSFGSNAINEFLSNASAAASTATYSYSVSNAGCSNTQSFSVAVNPLPTLTSALAAGSVCSGSAFAYTPSSAQAPNVVYNWSRAAVANITNPASSGTGAINEPLINSTLNTTVAVVYTYSLSNTSTGCDNNLNVTVNVNPIPNIGNQAVNVCNHNGFLLVPSTAPAGTTYTWSPFTGSSTPPGAITGSQINAQTVETPYINETIYDNTTGASADVVYTVRPNLQGCIGSNFTVTATVASGATPTITLASSTTPPAICSGNTFVYTISSGSSSPSYAWKRLLATGISNAPNSGNTAFINESLVNTTFVPVNATYTVDVTSGGCTNSFVVTAAVNPGTTLSSSLTPAAICSNTSFNYTPTSQTPATNAYNWTRNLVSGISNSTNNGNGDPNETLINTTTAPVNVTYTYTLQTSAGCVSTPQNVIVTVNPTPVLLSSLTATAICSGGVLSYVPTSATTGTLFNWTRAIAANINNPSATGFNNVGETLTNTSLVPATATYVYTLTANACSNTQSVTAVVNPLPSASNQTASVCSGVAFDATPISSTVPAGTTYTWGVPVNVTAGVVTNGTSATGQASVSQTLNNITTAAGVINYNVAPIANGCQGSSFAVQVTVKPVPVIGSATLSSVCSGSSFTYNPPSVPTGTAFTWSAASSSPPGVITGGIAQANQPAITQTLINGGLVTANATYQITPVANGCQGSDFSLTVPVAPTPQVSAINVAVCSGFAFTATPPAVPAGTTYTWAVPVTTPSGSVNSSAQATPVSLISQTLTNNTTSSASSVYTVIPVSGSCQGASFPVTVTVNPATQLSSSLSPSAVCSGETFNYVPTSATSGTNFSWGRAVVAGISNTAGAGSNDPNETLINATASPLSVVYTYSLSTTAGCNNVQNVTVVVKPTPKLNPQTINPVCSGQNSFTYNPTSATTGTTFIWNRSALTGITNPQASGTGDPNEALINSTLNTIAVTYVYSLSANGCSNTESVIVNVHPVPVVGDLTAIICSGETFTVTPTNVPSNTQYSWATATSTPANVVGGGSAASMQPGITGTLTNGTISQATDLFAITPVANGCTGNAFSVTVTVKPVPVAANQSITPVCSGVAFDYTPSNVPANTKYSWGAPVITPLQGLTGASAASVQNSVSQSLISSNNISNTAVYIVTPVANGCTGSTFQVTVLVKPVPVVGNQSLAICSGNAFNVNPTAVPAGTQYTWTMPVYTPNGSVTGGSPEVIPQSLISQNLTNTTTAAVQSVYTVTPAVNGCAGNPFTITVGVNPGTQLNISTTAPAICSSNQFSYAAASNTPGTSFQWTRAVVAGISNPAASGLNNPLETLMNITSQPVTVTYNYVLTTPAGCADNETVSVRVNPTPQLASLVNPAAICSGGQFNYTPSSTVGGTAFGWTRNVVAFITNTSASGTGNPAEVLVSTSTSSINTFYDYTLTANGCASTTRVTLTVNPTPVIANQAVATCSNVAFNYAPGNVPSNTLYTWGAPSLNPTGSVSGASAATDQPGVSQLLVNQTLNTALARYTVTPSAGGCAGASFFVDVTLNPAASIGNQTLASVCSGSAFSYTPANVPSNTVYTWANPVITGALSGASAEPVSKQSISQTLSSNNNLVNNAVYTVTPSTNGCLGQPFNLTVFVKPTPSVTNLKDTICTGSSFSIAASPTPANTMYTWTTPNVFPFGAVIGQTNQPTPAPAISQTLFNTTSSAAQVIYTVTPVADGCLGNNFTLAVVVGANLPSIPNQTATICSGAVFNATPANLPSNTTYTWNSPTIAPANSIGGASAANLPQTAVSQLLDNLVTAKSTVVYNVSAKNNGCVSNNFTATVTVLPVPRTFVTGNATICRYPLDTLTVTFTGDAPYGFTYFDGTTATPHVLSNIPSSPYQLVVPSSPQSSRKLSFLTASNNGCINNKDTTYFDQVINPLPVGVLHSLHGPYICNNLMDTMFVTSPESLSYQWTRNGAVLPGAVDDSISTNVEGRYNVMMTNQYGCRDTASVFDTKIYVQQPVLRLKYDTYCINTLMNFSNITDTNLTGPTAWQWTFDNGTSATSFHASTSFATGGDHHITLKATQVYCPAYPTTLDTTVNINFPIPGVTMPSMSAYKGQSTPISVRSLPGYRYRWTPPYGINNPDAASTTFNNQNTQQYVINLISPAGCITQDSLLVRVFDDKLVEIFIPKSFTPNGDGINDVLYPYLSGIKEFKYFKVYNRYNQLVFETRNYDIGWNGSVNGTPQPMAIYIWVAVGIANDGSTVERKGQVLLLR